jgi:MraZ protein
MASRKTQFGWMAVGCVVGLLGVFTITWIDHSSTLAAQTNRLPLAVALARAIDNNVKVSNVRAVAKRPEPTIASPLESSEAESPQPLPPPLPSLPADKHSHKRSHDASPEPPPPLPNALTEIQPTPIANPEAAPPHRNHRSEPLSTFDNDSHGPPPPPVGLTPAQPAPTTIAPPAELPLPAIPEPAPATPSAPLAEPKAEPIPPPLPTADFVPPPADELKPVPQSFPAANVADKGIEAPANSGATVTPVGYRAPETPVAPTPVALPPLMPVVPPAVPTLPIAAPVARQTSPVGPSDAGQVTTDGLPPTAELPRASIEPPLAPAPGPVLSYQVRAGGETMRAIARRTLGGDDHWPDVHRLNPSLQPDGIIAAGATVKLPADACINDDDTVHPLPTMHPKATPHKVKAVLPLTGTFAVNLDDKKTLLLPRAIRDQLNNCDTLLVSPGSDQCLWLTNSTHLDRLAERLEHSPAREVDVRTFKRLYFAQTEKAPVAADGRITMPDRLAQFAGLKQEAVLIGIDDHFELWDAARWRQYTQQKSAAARAAMVDRD